jgi:hypothetical protein
MILLLIKIYHMSYKVYSNLGQLQEYTQQLFGSYTTPLRSGSVIDAVFALLDRTSSSPRSIIITLEL